LPASARAALERRLAIEPELNRQLDELRTAHESISGALQEMDQAQPFHGSTRQVERQIRQWTTRRLAEAARKPAGHRGARWIVQGVAAAAAVLIGFGIWRSMPNPSSVAVQPELFGPGTESVVSEVVTQSEDTLALRNTALDEAETELNAVAYLQETLVQ
jgi:anti-sigma factor RsiW